MTAIWCHAFSGHPRVRGALLFPLASLCRCDAALGAFPGHPPQSEMQIQASGGGADPRRDPHPGHTPRASLSATSKQGPEGRENEERNSGHTQPGAPGVQTQPSPPPRAPQTHLRCGKRGPAARGSAQRPAPAPPAPSEAAAPGQGEQGLLRAPSSATLGSIFTLHRAFSLSF